MHKDKVRLVVSGCPKSYGVKDDNQHNSSLTIDESEFHSKGRCFGSRHVFAFLGFLGLAVAYMMRVNLSIAIVDMVDVNTTFWNKDNASQSINDSDQCLGHLEPNSEKKGEFDWNSFQQGLILGSFFWGYMVSQIPGGLLAERFGGKYVFGLGTLLTSLFSLLVPAAARRHTGYLIALRVLTGMAEGVTLPAMHVLLSRWVPPAERSTIGAFVSAGMQFGTVIAYPLSGFLCQLPLDNGWPLAFYVPGAAGIVWFTAWHFLVSNGPDVHIGIDENEKHFILASTGGLRKKSIWDTPWRQMLSSIHVWAIVVAHTGQAWGFFMLLTELPTYMKTVLHYDLKSNSLLSALPYLAMCLSSNVISVVADYMLKKGVLDTTQTRKVFNSVGFLLPAFSLIGASYSGCNKQLSIALITIASGSNGAIYSGFQVNHIDIAPNFAGVAMGLTNCVANLCGFLAPYVVGVVVTIEGSISQWRLVFFISAAIYVVTNLFYVIFASGEEQPWNRLENGNHFNNPDTDTKPSQ